MADYWWNKPNFGRDEFKASIPNLVRSPLKHHPFRLDMYVLYFIQVEGYPHIKIGISTDVDTRLKHLQNQVPFKLCVRDVIIFAPQSINTLERKFHHDFADRRGFGEWFNVSIDELRKVADENNLRRIEIPEGSTVREILLPLEGS